MLEKKKEELKETLQQAEQKVEELSEDLLAQVNGAGNPFEDIPRVPTQPIDDKLRDKA